MGIENVIIVKTKNQFNETEYRIGITNCKRSEEEDIEEIKKYGDIITKEMLLKFFEDQKAYYKYYSVVLINKVFKP